jgi:hypothetical protein
MTQTTLIIANSILGAAVAYGVIWLLAVSIGLERASRDHVRQLRRTTDRRLAA